MTLQDDLLSCISRMSDPDEAESNQNQLSEILIRVGEEPFFEALDRAIREVEGSLQSLACSFAVRIRPKSEYAERANRILSDNLSRGSQEDRLQTAYVIFYNDVASDTHVPHLVTIWKNTPADDNRRLWVAGAIFHGASPDGAHGEIRLEMMKELRSALKSEDMYSVLMASLSFRSDRIHQGESEKALLHAARVAEKDFRYVLIGHLVRACGPSQQVIEFLTEVASNENEDIVARVFAIVALARTPNDLTDVDAAMMTLLTSHHWNIVSNAVSAIAARNGTLPPVVIDKLVGFLNHDEVNFRGSAVRHLLDAGPNVLRPLHSLLVQRLADEEDEAVLEAIVVAIAATGTDALPLLEKAIEESSLSRIVFYQYTLFAIGRRHAAEVAGLMESENARVRQATAWALQSMASDAAPAIGVLQRLLASEDQDILRDVLISMRQIGPSALPATQRLAQLLDHRDESIRNWASDAILMIGPNAIGELQNAMRRASGDQRTAIESVIQQIARIALPEVSRPAVVSIDGVNEEDLLERFVLMGEVLNVTGPLSFLKLERAIAERHPDSSCSASTLRRTVDTLEQQWSEFAGKEIVLIDRQRNAKGEITKVGKRYLKRAQEFLEQVRSSRRPKE